MANPAKIVQEVGAGQPGGEMDHCRLHDGAPGGLETGHPVALISLKMPAHAAAPWTCSCWELGLSRCRVDILPFIHQNTWVWFMYTNAISSIFICKRKKLTSVPNVTRQNIIKNDFNMPFTCLLLWPGKKDSHASRLQLWKAFVLHNLLWDAMS